MEEIFNIYAKLYVTHADLPLLDYEGFQKATIAWEEKKKEELDADIKRILNKPRDFYPLSFDFIYELDSLMFWKPLNWRNFHIFELSWYRR